MQQIADWLGKLGMSEYAERFADNKIDTSVLPHLTDQDLCRCEYFIATNHLETDCQFRRRHRQNNSPFGT